MQRQAAVAPPDDVIACVTLAAIHEAVKHPAATGTAAPRYVLSTADRRH
jgi:hypothetical protein